MSKQTKLSNLFGHGMISADFVHTYNALAHEITDTTTAVTTNARPDYTWYLTRP